MNKIGITTILIIFFVIGNISLLWGKGENRSSEQIILQNKYIEGSTVSYKLNLKVNSTTTLNNKLIKGDKDSKDKLNFDMDMNMDINMKVEKVYEDGTAEITLESERFTQTYKTNEETLSTRITPEKTEVIKNGRTIFDSSKHKSKEGLYPFLELFTKSIMITIDKSGGVAEFSGTEVLEKIVPQLDLSEILQQIQNIFPKNPISIGDKWTLKTSMKIPNMVTRPININVMSHFDAIKEIKGVKCAKISYGGTGLIVDSPTDIDLKINGDKIIVARIDKLKGIIKGQLYFDYNQGKTKLYTINVDSEGEIFLKTDKNNEKKELVKGITESKIRAKLTNIDVR